MKKLFIRTSTMNRKIREAELNIIDRLEKSSIDSDVIDKIVNIVSNELEVIIER